MSASASKKKTQQPQHLDTFQKAHQGDVSKAAGFSLNPLIIRVDPGFNVRDEDSEDFKEYIESLTQAYINDQFVPPIIVSMRDNEPTVVDGHCRLQAMLNAIERGKEIERTPVIEYQGENELDRQLMLITANAGRNLTPTEEAKVYHRLANAQGFTVDEIAEHVGQSTAYIKQRIELYELPVKLKKFIDEKRIAYTLALKLYREYGSEAIQIIEDTIRKMDAVAAKAEKDGKKAPKKAKVTEGKIANHRRMNQADNRFVRSTLSTLAETLINDNSRVHHVKSQDRVDVSFNREEFLIFADLMGRVRKYDIDDMREEAEKTGQEVDPSKTNIDMPSIEA